MFRHEKRMLHDVRVDRVNPTYATMLQEQLGGAHGELKAGLQYISQSFRVRDPAIRDLFLDIGAEELSHLEMVAQAVNLLNGHDLVGPQAHVGNVQAHVVSGLTPMLTNASGYPWTGAYLENTGDLAADLLSNIAAEQRAKVVYEYLYRQINDRGVRETIDFLLNREEAHNALFREALNRVTPATSQRDFGVDKQARLYFDLSTPGRHFGAPRPTSPAFRDPRAEHGRQAEPPARAAATHPYSTAY